MLRQIAADAGLFSPMLFSFNMITFNTRIEGLIYYRSDDVDELVADQVHDLEEEQRRLYDERLRGLMEDRYRDIYRPSDVPLSWLMSLHVYAVLRLD